MNFNEYQELAARTVNSTLSERERIANFALGLAGEAGEVIELLKKHLYHNKPLALGELKKELGDVQWYLSGIAYLFGMSLEDVAAANIEKLEKRYPNGFGKRADEEDGA